MCGYPYQINSSKQDFAYEKKIYDMYQDSGPILYTRSHKGENQTKTVYYDIQTSQGQSGSPIQIKNDNNYRNTNILISMIAVRDTYDTVGVHTGSHLSDKVGTIITNDIFLKFIVPVLEEFYNKRADKNNSDYYQDFDEMKKRIKENFEGHYSAP